MARYDLSQLEAPGTDGQYLRSAGGVWVPRSTEQTIIDLGVKQFSQTVVYGNSTTAAGNLSQNITAPTWASEYRIRLHGSGAGGHSGVVQATVATAVSGGATGGAGFYLDVFGAIADLLTYGLTLPNLVLNLTLGAPGNGGAGVTGLTGNLGTGGTASTIAINGTTAFRANGGTVSNATTTAGSNTSTFGGGIAGNSGVAGGSTTGNAGIASNILPIAGGSGSGAGIAASGTANNGGAGARGATTIRVSTEALPAGGTTASPNAPDAVAILVHGLPVPGNGPGGGASSTTGNGGNGGNGINGSPGGGGGSCRSGTSGAGGVGGRAWAIVEFWS